MACMGLHGGTCKLLRFQVPHKQQRTSRLLRPWLQVPVIYGFGHGLSYTELQYSSLRVSAEPLDSASASSYNVSVDVRNTGRC